MKKVLRIFGAVLFAIVLMPSVVLAGTYKVSNEAEFVKAIVTDCLAHAPNTVIIPVNGFKIDFNKARQLIAKAITSNGDILSLVNQHACTISSVRGRQTVASVKLSYHFVETKEQEAKVNDYIKNNILPVLKSAKDDYEKVYLINEWIKNNVSYDTTYKNQSSYNAIFNRKATCNGYAMLFNKIAKASGLESKVIIGKAKNAPHAWNAVKVNGVWYFVDPTWNDTTGFNKYLLLSLQEISVDHKAETALPQPVAQKSYFAELLEKAQARNDAEAMETITRIYDVAFCATREDMLKEVTNQLKTKSLRKIMYDKTAFSDEDLWDAILTACELAQSDCSLEIVHYAVPVSYNNKEYGVFSLGNI